MGLFPSQIVKDKTLNLGLNVGCGMGGTCLREPYINVDNWKERNYPSWKKKMDSGPPIFFMIADVEFLPFKSNRFDEVYASHILEHFNWIHVKRVLKEWFRVLKVKGLIKICVPCFEWAVQVYTGEKQTGQWDKSKGLLSKKNGDIQDRQGMIYRVVYGHDSREENDVGHKCVFDYELLEWLLEQTGFHSVRRGQIHSMPYPAIHEELVVVANK